MNGKPLASKAALVTGGARRIGRAVALRLAQAGANVAITYRNSKQEAEQTAGRLEALGVQSMVFACDLRQEESVRMAVATVAAHFGRLDIVVNNAGVFEQAPLETLTASQWDAVFETNTRGPFLVVREALPHLRRVQGRIVNLTSLGGAHAWASHAHYCASKAALEMLTKTMAKAFAPEVTANCVAPGWIDADDAGGLLAEHFAKRTPMRRNGTAEEVAEAVLFFAAGPGFITGQTLAVDGGLGL